MSLGTDTITFGTALKVLPTEGNLVYEYNPFFNYRLSETMIYYLNRLWKLSEFCDEFGLDEDTLESGGYSSWPSTISSAETLPVVYQAGLLVDFETDELSFSINNPVNITALWSYDNSVNLIINDGLNPPRLINSRFSPTERHLYLVCNRKGDNDTNIYDLGDLFDIDTSLYKKITTIPKITFNGAIYGGNLPIGNYHFYFKYVDEDGNESDFFGESGLVSLFIGNTPDSIYSGFRDENSHRQVKFTLSNTDVGYSKVLVYYTKATSDLLESAITSAYKIDLEYYLNENGSTIITITGYEDKDEITIEEINTQYLVYGSAETLCECQNRLFLGNLDRPEIPYEDLADCALRFLPYVVTDTYDMSLVGLDYTGSSSNTYYNTSYIYKRTGYWDDEIYRFGIVFILSDYTLSDVFNVRGRYNLSTSITASSIEDNYTAVDFYDDENRNYINYDPQYYTIVDSDGNSSGVYLENAKGVIHINEPSPSAVIGINFAVEWQVLIYLRETLGIKGFFFVRQKRIPTTLCQAYIIGVDKLSYTPVLPIDSDTYCAESFLDTDTRYLSHEFSEHKREIDSYLCWAKAAICPEYDVNMEYLNSLFTGSELVVRNCNNTNYLENSDRHFYPSSFEFEKGEGYSTVKILGMEDDIKLGAIGETYFRGRAGEAEEAFRFEYIGKEEKLTEVEDLLRGSYGPFLGITGYEHAGHLVDIKIPGYSTGYMDDYFSIRYNDKAPFYAVSERIDLSSLVDFFYTTSNGSVVNYVNNPDTYAEYYVILREPVYRGDCYICQFTHRLNRNFQDPSAPTNDDIVDSKCWEENFEVEDKVVKTESFDDINLGDVNAVMLGMWITLVVRSTYNLNIRAINGSYTDEVALTGHKRGFYPFYPMSAAGSYKIPEACCINKGFLTSLSLRLNYELMDTPWIKNEFSNRIAYSNIQVQDAFQNGWRTFPNLLYRDYPKTYGSITKIEEFRGQILCVFEHGVALIPINERTVAGEGSGGNVFINTPTVLPLTYNTLSDTFGSQWRESVIKTPNGVYGVDTIGKKIWRTNGLEFECISDFKVQEFLNNNISLGERELTPIIGVRNVKSHYNKYKHDIMFTFYDNLYGFEEKVWNLCYNELQLKWITFYSWIPSYSENIYNQYFSFDRNTSKWIAKLGISKSGNDFSDGVTLENNIIESDSFSTLLSLSNRTLPEGDNTEVSISYELVRDNYGNYKYFTISGSGDSQYLTFTGSYEDFCSEFYLRTDGTNTYKPTDSGYSLDLSIYTDDSGRRQWLDLEDLKNPDKIVILLNIRANITVSYTGVSATLEEAYSTGLTNLVQVDAGYYESVVALIVDYNMQFLTTDFWKHGRAGIIDIADDIYPTYWYGKLHPFEFEFVVADNPLFHKIFDNLLIVSNSAEPESFHYEIVGDCFDFAKDKKNMYIRQEATKELYLYNGLDVVYDSDYSELESTLRDSGAVNSNGGTVYDKSTLLPLYYSRQDTINEVEDYYHLKDDVSTKDFSALAGGEVVHYKTLDEYRIWNHAKAVDIVESGRMRGNMLYKEDIWDVQINPINIVLKNEPKWTDLDGNSTDKIPAELKLSPVPDELLSSGSLEVPDSDGWENRGYVLWGWSDSQMKEVKVKDKWVKIRIRYSGEKLAIISAIKTLYSISYG